MQPPIAVRLGTDGTGQEDIGVPARTGSVPVRPFVQHTGSVMQQIFLWSFTECTVYRCEKNKTHIVFSTRYDVMVIDPAEMIATP